MTLENKSFTNTQHKSYEVGPQRRTSPNQKESGQREGDRLEQQRRREAERTKNRLADVASFLGMSRYRQGKYEEAVQSFQEVTQLQPSNAEAFNWLGVSLHQLQRYNEAEDTFKQALNICQKIPNDDHPALVSILENYAALLEQTDRESEAIKLNDRIKAIQEAQKKREPQPSPARRKRRP